MVPERTRRGLCEWQFQGYAGDRAWQADTMRAEERGHVRPLAICGGELRQRPTA